jgi:hypothetical protein
MIFLLPLCIFRNKIHSFAANQNKYLANSFQKFCCAIQFRKVSILRYYSTLLTMCWFWARLMPCTRPNCNFLGSILLRMPSKVTKSPRLPCQPGRVVITTQPKTIWWGQKNEGFSNGLAIKKGVSGAFAALEKRYYIDLKVAATSYLLLQCSRHTQSAEIGYDLNFCCGQFLKCWGLFTLLSFLKLFFRKHATLRNHATARSAFWFLKKLQNCEFSSFSQYVLFNSFI